MNHFYDLKMMIFVVLHGREGKVGRLLVLIFVYCIFFFFFFFFFLGAHVFFEGN